MTTAPLGQQLILENKIEKKKKIKRPSLHCTIIMT